MVEALMEPEAMAHLAELAAQVPAEQAILEIGTYHAANLVNMAQAAKQGGGAHVYGVDAYGQGAIYPGRPHMLARYTTADEQIARDHIRANHLVRATTLIVNTSTQAAKTYNGPPIALLVIDGEHRYHAVINDYRAWQPHLTLNATIAFDDYGGKHGAEVITAVKDLGLTVNLIGTRMAITQ